MPSAPCTTHARVRAEHHQRASEQLRQLWTRNADELPRCTGRIRQRAEQIERRPNAQLAPRLRGVLHRRMERPREKERDAGVAQRPLDDRGRCIDIDAERLEDISRSAAARHRSIAVLRDRHAARRDARSRRPRKC